MSNAMTRNGDAWIKADLNAFINVRIKKKKTSQRNEPRRYDARRDKRRLYENQKLAQQVLDFSMPETLVLRALIGCFDQAPTPGVPVWPSNCYIEKETGLDERQICRALNKLIEKGILIRRRSANGKRYAVRNSRGQIVDYFGFDLSPLMEREGEFRKHVDAIKDAEVQRKLKCNEITISRQAIEALFDVILECDPNRDLSGLKSRLGDLINRTPRRNNSRPIDQIHGDYLTLEDECRALYEEISEIKFAPISHEKSNDFDILSDKMSGNACQGVMHIEYNPYLSDQFWKKDSDRARRDGIKNTHLNKVGAEQGAIRLLSITDIKRACPNAFENLGIRDDNATMNEFVSAANFLRGQYGASGDAWKEAVENFGANVAAAIVLITVEDACIAENRGNPIQNWGGYFRNWMRKAYRKKTNINEILLKMKLENYN